MKTLLSFFSFSEPNVQYVVFGTVLLMISSSLIGTFLVLQKKSLVGEAISHAVFPGICIAYIICKGNNPMILIIGALVFGYGTILLMESIPKHSKIKADSATAVVLSSTFGLGLLLMSHIQKSNNSAQLGLNNFLLGKAASLIGRDVKIFMILSLLVALIICFLIKELIVVCFDKQFAISVGIKVKLIEYVLALLTVISIVVGIRAVGILLMSAMLISPAYSATFWTSRISKIIPLTVFFSAISGVTGAYISYVTPFMPTGPWIVFVATLIAYFSFLFAPNKGLISKRISLRRHKIKVLDENILKFLYKFIVSAKSIIPIDFRLIVNENFASQKTLIFRLKILAKKKLISINTDNTLELSTLGYNQGKRIYNLHKLWELYLKKILHIKNDHVHEDAESIEHIISPELEFELRELLKNK